MVSPIRLATLVVVAAATAAPMPAVAQDGAGVECGALLMEAWDAVAESYYDLERLRRGWDAVKPEDGAACPDGAHAAIRDLLSHVDDRAVRLVPAAGVEAFLADMAGTTPVGVGLRELLSLDVDERTGLLTVVTPIPGGPAARAGVESGDILEAIDGIRSDTMDLALAMSHLRGPDDTELELRVRRNDRVRTVRLMREQLPPGPGAVLRILEIPGDGAIAYLRPPDFAPGTADTLQTRLVRADSQAVRGVILDLRDNPGGFVDELTGASDLFLPAGTPVARVRGRPGQDTQLATAEDGEWEGPLVVLINRGTASAAEALAGAIQAAGRGMVLGQRSFGKGLAHVPTQLADGSLVLAPSGRLQTPHGRDILSERIEPDIWLLAPPLSTLLPDLTEDALVREVLKQLSVDGVGGQAAAAPSEPDIRSHQFESLVIGNSRMLRVLVPVAYGNPANRHRQYPVLYLNDGLNLP